MNKKIGLALSGGGVLGASHIGVIEELEKNNINIEYICGCSSGAIIGAVYAHSGISGLNNLYVDITDETIFDRKKQWHIISPAGFFKEIEKILEKYLPQDFRDFKTPFSTVATNFSTGEMEILDSGNPVKAVLASAAYPGVFPIQKFNDRYYVDGGVTRNMPADIVKERCDFVIGSSIYGVSIVEQEKVSKMSRIVSLLRTVDILEKELSKESEKYCDFCFKPDTYNLRWYHFLKIKNAREAGREYAQKEIGKLLELLER